MNAKPHEKSSGSNSAQVDHQSVASAPAILLPKRVARLTVLTKRLLPIFFAPPHFFCNSGFFFFWKEVKTNPFDPNGGPGDKKSHDKFT